jgi:hypothetical protein
VVLGPKQLSEVAANFLLFVLLSDGQAISSLEELNMLLSFSAICLEVEEFCVSSVMFNICHS